MQIHFCDLCNESVPQSDLDVGRAFMRKGRVVCARCDEAMSASEAAAAAQAAAGAGAGTAPSAQVAGAPAHAAHPHPTHLHDLHAPQPTRGAGTGISLAAIALLVVGVLAYWTNQQLNDLDRRTAVVESSARDVTQQIAATNERQTKAAAELELDLSRSAAEQRDMLDAKLAASAQQAQEAGRQVAAQLAAFQAKVDELKQACSAVGRHDSEIVALQQLYRELEGELRSLAPRIDEVASAAAAAASAAESHAAVAPAAVQQPAWSGLLEQLSSKSASERWQAVIALGETRDPAVVPHLVPALHDEDVFNRIAVARALGDLGSPAAVPPLIGALGDSEPSVREAAYVALRTITKRDISFDAQTEDVGERNKRIKAWEDWWKKEGERLSGA